MILEVIATTVTDAVIAEQAGADRIELISGIKEGGVTPSLGLIEQVVRKVNIPVRVMVRPHANSYCYDAEDLEVMRRDIACIRQTGAAGVVLGVLTPDRQIDWTKLDALIEASGDLPVTFHRAFDEVSDQGLALERLRSYSSITHVLTSGGKPTAPEAAEQIRHLQKQSERSGITILAGSGLSLANLQTFMEQTDVREVHLGTGVRVHGEALAPLDPNKVKAAVDLIAKIGQAS